MARTLLSIGVACVLVSTGTGAFAACTGVTAPPVSVSVCPSGDMEIRATFDVAGVPCAGETVFMDLGPALAAGLWLHPAEPAIVPAVTGPDGVAVWNVRAGGCVTAPVVFFSSGGAFAETPEVISPDIDANGLVNLADFVLFSALFSGPGPCGDFDDSFFVDLGDFVTFQMHFGH